MKKYLFVLLSAALLAFVGCNKEIEAGGSVNGTEDASGDFVYIDVTLSQPSAVGTRSATDNVGDNGGSTNSDANPSDGPDFEYGWDYENDVNSVLLVIANSEDKLIAFSAVTSIAEAPGSNPLTENFKFTANAKFKKSTIEAAYEGEGLLVNNKTVRLYAYCNYSSELAQQFASATVGGTEWLDFAGTLSESVSASATPSIWAERGFLMTNAATKTATFPEDKNAWNNFTTEGNPFHLSQNNPSVRVDNGYGGADDPIKVERAAARIDFRDAAKDNNAQAEAFTYYLKSSGTAYVTADQTMAEPNLLNIKLTEMSLVNMSKNYYLLRRVSDDGKATGTNFSVCGVETPRNYVVDTDYETKAKESNAGGYTPASAANAFNFPLYGSAVEGANRPVDGAQLYEYNAESWYTTKISDINNNPEDTWSNTTYGSNGYHIWRYVTENTSPGTETQKTIQSVGVVFKGKIMLGADAARKSAVADPEHEGQYTEGNEFLSAAVRNAISNTDGESPTLYYAGGLFYAGFADMVDAAVSNGPGSAPELIASAVLGNWYLVTATPADASESAVAVSGKFEYSETGAPSASEGQTVFQLTPAIYAEILHHTVKGEGQTGLDFSGCSVDDKLNYTTVFFKGLLTAQNVTMFDPSQDAEGNWGYYCYYFYWNRHNDNGNNGLMGVMEFATVRNNVYKLAVTGLRRLGHPENPENDPEPIIPDDPDEEDVVYMDVKIEVLPWVVRVNNIEF